MKKKLVIVLVIVALILAAAVSAVVGYLWYRNNHVFVEGTAYEVDLQTLDLRGQDISFGHYEALKEQLPNCEITWDVPFQGGKHPNTAESLIVTDLTEQDIGLMVEYFPNLKTVDATGCTNYPMIEMLQKHKNCEVSYSVGLGGKSYAPDTAELVLEKGDYDFETLMVNLFYLRDLQDVQLKMPELTTGQMEELRSAYPHVTFTCTVEILGREYDNRVTELDLKDLESAQVAEVVEKLPMLPNVTFLELTKEDGTSNLTPEDVKLLKAAAPNASVHYVFDFYGVKLSTSDKEVKIYGKNIGDEGIDNLRAALELMEGCERFVVEYCRISYDLLAQVREEFRGRTKLVWRVEFGGGSTFTDAEIIRCTYDLVDDNCYNLIYCEDARFIDIGHNEFLDAVPFVAGMPNLEMIIVSGAPIKDLTPFENCKKLKVLEIAFCHYIEDISPLAKCESLEMLNIGFTQVKDLSALDGLNMTNLCIDGAKVSAEERDRFQALKKDCWITYDDAQPYNDGWRYTEENQPLPWYGMIRSVFRYDKDPNIPNNVGWYLPEDFEDVLASTPMPIEEEATEETVPEETLEETVPAA